MVSAETEASCRAYIVYHHGLFAQGVRSVLETRNAARIVGMESDVGKALKAVQSLKPEVIIVEERTGKHRSMQLGALLDGYGGGRVVTLSLDHGFAIVYHRERMAAKDPADLIKLIRGNGTQEGTGRERHVRNASLLFKPTARANGNREQSRPTVRVVRTGRNDATKAQKVPRATRARKGG